MDRSRVKSINSNMEININIQTLSVHLVQISSPDPSIRKSAEKFLEAVKVNKNYPQMLLKLIDPSNIVDFVVRVAGSIALKSYVKEKWKIVDGVSKIPPEGREAMKSSIVTLMMKSTKVIQRHLCEVVIEIGKEDFPKQWPGLLRDLISILSSDDYGVINSALHIVHSLFKRYRLVHKSEDLWQEIEFVMKTFAAPFTILFQRLMELATFHRDKKSSKVIYTSLLMVTKIFNSVNAQDIPKFFKENMNIWMTHFHTLLITDNPTLTTEDKGPGLLEQIRSQVCDNIGIYAQKYGEEFQELLPQFISAICNWLRSTGNQSKYDLLVCNAIHFLVLLAKKQENKHLFDDPATVKNICKSVIIPNIEFRDSDHERFQNDPEEYILRDIENSGVNNRRHLACDLAQSLGHHFGQQITEIFGQYVMTMLSEYNQNPVGNWKSKDSVTFLVTNLIATKQQETMKAMGTFPLVNVCDFYNTHILPDLEAPDVNELPVLKADAIKYLITSRHELPIEFITNSLPFLICFLRANNAVIQAYAADCINKILIMNNNSTVIIINDTASIAQELLCSLHFALDKPTSKETKYVIKRIMQSLSTAHHAVIDENAVMKDKLNSIRLLTDCRRTEVTRPNTREKPHLDVDVATQATHMEEQPGTSSGITHHLEESVDTLPPASVNVTPPEQQQQVRLTGAAKRKKGRFFVLAP